MRGQTGISGLLDTFDHAAGSDDPSKALMQLLRDCVLQTRALRGDLYLLDLSRNSLILGGTTSEAAADESIPLNPSSLSRADWQFRTVFRTKKPVWSDRRTGGRAGSQPPQVLVPVVQENACLGVIRLLRGPEEFDAEAVAKARLVARLAALLIEKRYTLQLLTVMEKPINYQQPRDAFLDELMLVAAEASGFPHIVLRELDKDGTMLECLRSFGFSTRSLSDLHLSPLADFPLFAAAVTSRTTQVLDGNVSKSGTVLVDVVESAELQRVVVVPIIVGPAVFGTASFSVACDHDITKLERRGLEAVANSIGGAIANYRNVGLAHEVFFERAKAAAAFTTVDVAQAARHEARNYVHNAQTNMATLSKTIAKSPSKIKPDMSALIDDVFNDLGRIDIALDKIKAITKPVDHARETYDAAGLWHEAFELVGGRLHAMNVRYTIRGAASIECIPDLLRHGFLQLALNSIDSFKETSRKRGHTIAVSIEECNDDIVQMRYSDNGIGLDMAKLIGKDGQAVRKVSDIFLPGVTTKQSGSGYGLYLARRALDEHHGSIDILDHRNGMSFKIELARRMK